MKPDGSEAEEKKTRWWGGKHKGTAETPVRMASCIVSASGYWPWLQLGSLVFLSHPSRFAKTQTPAWTQHVTIIKGQTTR